MLCFVMFYWFSCFCCMFFHEGLVMYFDSSIPQVTFIMIITMCIMYCLYPPTQGAHSWHVRHYQSKFFGSACFHEGLVMYFDSSIPQVTFIMIITMCIMYCLYPPTQGAHSWHVRHYQSKFFGSACFVGGDHWLWESTISFPFPYMGSYTSWHNHWHS